MTRTRIGIYDRFWSTMGGGEQHAGAAAAVLAEHFDVELIGMEEFDRQRFSSILGRPILADLPLRIVGLEPTAIAEVSKNYDIFVNHSYTSEDVSLAKKSIYVVFFPQVYGDSSTQKLRKLFRLTCSSQDEVSTLAHDKVELNTSGELRLKARQPGRMSFAVVGADSIVDVRNSNGNVTFQDQGGGRFLAAFDFPKGETQIAIHGSDVSVLVPQLANGQRIPIQFEGDQQSGSSPAFIDSYDLVLANSSYTQAWVRNRWHKDAVVHYPPVELRSPSLEKEQIVLSVGRFFDESKGHSKQQLRLVRAFKKMIDDGLEGWKLVLIGGCDKANRDYALQVRREALGYPIEVRLNANYAVLDEHLSRASIYWHATGFGVDLNRFPERAEHFGIAPVEAMSAGAIPVVFGLGGPREIVDYGINGFFFLTEEELVAHTLEVIKAPADQLLSMRQAAIQTSERFSPDRFADELLTHVYRLIRT